MKTIIFGGSGEVGTLLSEMFVKYGHEVDIVDLKPPISKCHKYFQCSFLDFDFDTLSDYDYFILAVHEDHILNLIKSIKSTKSILSSRACLIDTLSVKCRVVGEIVNSDCNFEYLSINPLFGPSLGFSGQVVAQVGFNAGSKSYEFQRMVQGEGGSFIRCSAEEHDMLASLTQSLVHMLAMVFGRVLDLCDEKGGLVNSMATPPFKVMKSLRERMAYNSPDSYYSIQVDNQYSEVIRELVLKATSEFNFDLSSMSRAAFIEKYILVDSIEPTFVGIFHKLFDPNAT